MPFANHPDTTNIYYETYGEGTPILFVHPPAMGHVTFKEQRPLAQHFQMITVDLRGNGRSDNQAEKITMKLIVEDLKAVVDAVGVEKVVLCGYSNGGSIAQEFALTYPERALGVILCGGFSEVTSFLLRNEFRLGIYAAQFKLMRLMSFALATAHTRSKLFQMELEDYVKKTDPKVLRNMYNEGLHYVSTDRLDQLTVPLLLVYGEKDHYVHHYQDIFLDKVKTDVDIVYISGVKHQVPTKKSMELNRIIYNFVKRKVEKAS
ncbi:alpha/beta hydrolase [Anaerobacillus alkaliphilus]|uniref:Alpha/beta hydrolase n=1 Tax=Anaerobacillus alkaliphilus TaxID=1548597 RepID=A0A4Q0VY16_9BACI|nr:alpha/beta hydrolase [Anaerobacillus alkaliphilus]RXJ02734.1 alpha/beta hydrolase [Anaerobacillus alkaliphilus]